MQSRKWKPYYSHTDLVTLQSAFDHACSDLKLRPDDQLSREILGELIFTMATRGDCSNTNLGTKAVEQFTHLRSARRAMALASRSET